MTQHRTLKRRVRARMSKTGERYTAARRQLLTKATPDDGNSKLAAPATVPDVNPSEAVPVPDSPFRGGYGASDEALVKRTGHPWEHWYRLLDAWGGADKPHPAIARFLNEEHGVDGWWSQELTVRFEMAVGRRVPGQRPDGFEATASKTFDVPVQRLFDAVVDEAQRHAWLSRPLRLRTATAPKSGTSIGTARFDWEEAPQRIVFWFTAKGARSNVALAHQRMPDKPASDAMKVFWRDRLKALQALLQGGS